MPRKSVVRLTDRPDMTLDVYRGRKTTIQQNFQCRGVLLIWIRVGQGATALAVCPGGGLFGHFFLSSVISLFFLPLSGRMPDID